VTTEERGQRLAQYLSTEETLNSKLRLKFFEATVCAFIPTNKGEVKKTDNCKVVSRLPVTGLRSFKNELKMSK
jgi:hypothetical protein